jgi:galactokinase
MMGGGFGGCTINLVKGELSEQFQNKLKADYQNVFGLSPEIFDITSSHGILQVE